MPQGIAGVNSGGSGKPGAAARNLPGFVHEDILLFLPSAFPMASYFCVPIPALRQGPVRFRKSLCEEDT